MTHLYGARGSFHVLRPKNTIELMTESADKWICMGKWACEILAVYVLKEEKAPDDRTFFPQWARY